MSTSAWFDLAAANEQRENCLILALSNYPEGRSYCSFIASLTTYREYLNAYAPVRSKAGDQCRMGHLVVAVRDAFSRPHAMRFEARLDTPAGQVGGHNFGATFRQLLVIAGRAQSVGVAFDDDALDVAIGQWANQFFRNRCLRSWPEIGFIKLKGIVAS